MDVNAAFAAWLRSAREKTGMSQQKVADALKAEGFGFAQTQIAKIERCGRPVRLDEAVAMARIFGTTLDEVLGLKSSPGSVADGRYGRRGVLLQQLRDAIDAELGGDR